MIKKLLFVAGGLLILGFVFFYYSSSKVETIKITTSFPMRSITVGQEIVNGIKMAFEEKNYKVGNYTIDLVVGDDGDESGRWQASLETAIATEAVNDPDVMAYLGTYNSGAAKISIPITNRGGLVQISPGNTWPGLTQAGFAPGEPGIFYPTGVRNYFRVVPTDALQGPSAAIWARDLGVKTIIIFDDGETYGKGIADLFEKKALEIGMRVLAHKTINSRGSQNPLENVSDVASLKADLVYFGGVTPNGAAPLLKNVKRLGMAPRFMGPDGIVEQGFINQAGDDAEGVYATVVGMPPEELTGAGEDFYNKYKEKYGVSPGTFSIFGYEEANVIMLAIERAAAKDRAKILREVSRIKDYDGLLGKWSFDKNGDTTLDIISGNKVVNKIFEFERILSTSK